MALERIAGQGTMGGYFIQKALKDISIAHGEVTIDLSKLDKGRVAKLVTAIKRGYSRGKDNSEQYVIYALLCQRFGLLHSMISNSRLSWVAIPEGARPNVFRDAIFDKVTPMFQLTGQDTVNLKYWCHVSSRLDQPVVTVRRPLKVPMNVMGKAMMTLLPPQDYAKQVAAMDFIKSGGKIQFIF